MIKNLKFPVDFSNLVNGKGVEFCSEEKSIAQNIMLIITSRYGEVSGRDDYGSAIWELEFNQLVRISTWEEEVQESLLEAISNNEKRLRDIKVKVILSEIDDTFFLSNKNTHIRRKSSITVTGIIVENDKHFNFNTLLYISPLAQ